MRELTEVFQVDTPREVEFSVWYHIAVAAAQAWVPSHERCPYDGCSAAVTLPFDVQACVSVCTLLLLCTNP